MILFQVITGIIFICYLVLITVISRGWFILKTFKPISNISQTRVSLIVAVRNEAGNIKNLLNSIFNQDYPSHLLEVIIVDDHSTDNTVQLLYDLAPAKQNFTIVKLEEENSFGKKAALDAGIRKATGELIIITDADCTANTNWISTLVSYYTEKRPLMILGPVKINYEQNIFSKLQSLEFVSLISSAAGSCNAGFPLLANGANIAFSKQAYYDCGGFTKNMNFSSGDDMFLMMNIKNRFGVNSIHFVKSADAIVSTNAIKGLRSFINQRKRWVSKSRGYTDPFLVLATFIVYLTNLILVATAFLAIIQPERYWFFIVIFLLKSTIDFPIMLNYSRFQGNVLLMWFFPLLELLNAFYTSFIGIAGNIGNIEWRGRRVFTGKSI
jgi:cellulose synthase/poly-beta-1,6-N-acetylglucosamine synthase-like glycosyltransferase